MPVHLDYHMHTPLCGHADGEPREYIVQGLRRGLTEIGFSDHMPLLAHTVPNIAMRMDELPVYQKMIATARDSFGGEITVRTGLEADYDPGYEERIAAVLNSYPYDYVIGSVHFIDSWGFDNPQERDGWERVNITQIYQTYYSLLRQAAATRLFDIIGHVDLVKKFGHRPDRDLTPIIRETAAVFKSSGVVIELNTAGLRKPVQEIYPSLADLKIYREAGVAITFGSDAHKPSEVAQDFDQARELALAAGYREFVAFAKRKISGAHPLQ